MTVLFFLTCFILFGIEAGDPSKGSLPCKLYIATRLDCSPRELTTTYPLGYPEAKYLDLSHNRLESLSGEHFAQLVGLQILDMSFNKLWRISSTAFSHFTSFWRLDLSNNPSLLSTVLELSNIPTLQDLNLRSTNLWILGSNKFKGLGKLSTLDLSFQNPSLKLALRGNQFQHLQHLKNSILACVE